MKKFKILAIVFSVSCFAAGAAQATEHHSGHGGGANGGGSGGGGECIKARLAKFLPAHLATVAPESEFSFVAYNIQKPEQVAVTVKSIPVELDAEFKDPFYLMKGKLPAALNNTMARINVKVSAKSSHCEAENGWLVKITDK